MTEVCLYAHNRTGILLDISKIFMELKVDIKSVSTRTSKQDLATIAISFEISGIDELNHIIKKLRNIESVIDVERNAG
ncbi:MAG: ACT domain-containing protein [Candidatus Enteromonas sp.]